MTDLIEAIRDYEQLTPDALPELKRIIEKYPYFQAPRLLYLSLLYRTDKTDFNNELKRSAIFITDRSGLYALIHDPQSVAALTAKDDTKTEATPDEGKTGNRSFALIDEFLSEYDDEKSPDKQEAVPENLSDKKIASDYTSYLEHIDEPGKEADTQSVPSPSVPISPRPIPKKAQTREEEVEAPVEQNDNLSDNYFTETLAKIYVKQGKYSKALEIIQRLYLRNPNKNAYFADQIRYLEKLIINSRNQKNKIK